MIFKFKKDYPYLRKNQFGNKVYEITLYKKIIFELLSFFGRLFSKQRVEINDIKYLQLGCGDSDIKKNYLNLDFYNKKFSNSFFRGFENGCEAIWYITQNFQHLSVWDSEMLELQLKKTGFKNFYKQEFNQGLNKDLLIDKNGRQVESLYAEAVK